MNTTALAKKIVKTILAEMQDEPAWDLYEAALAASDISLESVEKELISLTKNILEGQS